MRRHIKNELVQFVTFLVALAILIALMLTEGWSRLLAFTVVGPLLFTWLCYQVYQQERSYFKNIWRRLTGRKSRRGRHWRRF